MGGALLPRARSGPETDVPHRMIELVGSVEVQVEPGIHFLEWNCGAPRESESVCLAIHLHETAGTWQAIQTSRRGVEMGREITGVRRVAEDAVALLVRRMLDAVSGQGVASKAELMGGEERLM